MNHFDSWLMPQKDVTQHLKLLWHDFDTSDPYVYRIYTPHKLSVYSFWRMNSRRDAAAEGFDRPKIVYAQLVVVYLVYV